MGIREFQKASRRPLFDVDDHDEDGDYGDPQEGPSYKKVDFELVNSSIKLHLIVTGYLGLGSIVITKIGLGAFKVAPFVLIFSSFAILWFGVTAFLSRVRRNSMKTEDSIAESEKRIFSLSIDEAQQRSAELLNDPTRINFILATEGEVPILEKLTPLQRQFFQKYEEVRFVHGDARLNRSEITKSVYDGRYLKIGSDVEHAELVVLPGSEEILELEGLKNEERVSYPSLHHWLLRVADDIYGIG